MNHHMRRILMLALLCLGVPAASFGADTAPPPAAESTLPQPKADNDGGNSEASRSVDATQLDRAPRPIQRVPPVYPSKLKKKGVTGRVVVQFVIDEHGNVMNAKVNSSTNRAFDRPSIDAILQWKFEPGLKDGQPVRVLCNQEIPFQFQQPAEADADAAAATEEAKADGTVALPKFDANRGKAPDANWDERNHPPRPIYQVSAAYPFDLKKKGVSGQVIVEFVVDTKGNVRDARIVSSSDPGFENAVLQAVAKWKFRPGVRNGRVVNTRMQVPISFNSAPAPAGEGDDGVDDEPTAAASER
jgi:TonB family protein